MARMKPTQLCENGGTVALLSHVRHARRQVGGLPPRSAAAEAPGGLRINLFFGERPIFSEFARQPSMVFQHGPTARTRPSRLSSRIRTQPGETFTFFEEIFDLSRLTLQRFE